jgi:hypothetical protein
LNNFHGLFIQSHYLVVFVYTVHYLSAERSFLTSVK